jgi:hypothetical protein
MAMLRNQIRLFEKAATYWDLVKVLIMRGAEQGRVSGLNERAARKALISAYL